MIDYLLELNDRILLAINGAHTGFLDTFMMIATNRWTWIPLYVAAFVYLIYRYGWLRAVSVLAVIGITITIVDQLCGSLIRDSLQILRPSNPDNPLSAQIQLVDGYRGGRYGFPSCHAANCTALMMVLGTVIRRRWTWLVLTAYVLLNCYSRLYLGVHYPSDILAGAATGAAIGYGMGLLAIRIMRRLPPARREDPSGSDDNSFILH